eukprot:4876766-Prymnesium_polylepis.1
MLRMARIVRRANEGIALPTCSGKMKKQEKKDLLLVNDDVRAAAPTGSGHEGHPESLVMPSEIDRVCGLSVTWMPRGIKVITTG